jgi:rhomboid family GlyGly-CTERM serine protease
MRTNLSGAVHISEINAAASQDGSRPASHVSKPVAFLRQRPEIVAFVLLILIFNAPVFFGQVWRVMVFHPDAVRSGQWWRLFTHPFVHLTWYHLLLDGTAFLSLCCSLLEKKILRRTGYVVAAAAGSLIVSWVASSATFTRGLCGLSGVAHGLMAISALEMMSGAAAERRIGWIGFVSVVAKAGIEAATGRMFFGFLDFGLLGNPVAVSHAGGILGALMLYCSSRGECRG